MTQEDFKRLSKFKKEDLINIIIKKDDTLKNSLEKVKEKYLKKQQGLINEIKRLQEYISKFREMEDRYRIEKGLPVFVEYVSELGEVKTAYGIFIFESKNHITIKINDGIGFYRKHIKKKLINGIKEYYRTKTINNLFEKNKHLLMEKTKK